MKICVWRYLENQKNYPGYHLSACRDGCDHILSRLNDPWERSTIELSAPDGQVLSVPNANAKVHSFRKLRIETGSHPELESFTLREDGDTLILSLGTTGLAEFSRGINDAAEGSGDYSIHGEDDAELWFWWQV